MGLCVVVQKCHSLNFCVNVKSIFVVFDFLVEFWCLKRIKFFSSSFLFLQFGRVRLMFVVVFI